MRFLTKVKDGGPNSPVDAYVLLEIKPLFSIMLLKFNPGSRGIYHSHAFNALTWFLKGNMWEEQPDGEVNQYRRSFLPKFTPRRMLHNVVSYTTSWCFTIRGPWEDQWEEHDGLKITTLTHGRKIIKEEIWDGRERKALGQV